MELDLRNGKRDSVRVEIKLLAAGAARTCAQAVLAYYADDFGNAVRLAKSAEAKARKADDRSLEAEAARMLSDSLRLSGEYDKALAAAERAIDRHGGGGQPLAWQSKAEALRVLRHYPEALEALSEALRRARRQKDAGSEARALYAMAMAYGRVPDYPRALRSAEAALLAARKASDLTSSTIATGAKARALFWLNRHEEARAAAEDAAKIAEDIGYHLGVANALLVKIRTCQFSGDYGTAIAAAQAARDAAVASNVQYTLDAVLSQQMKVLTEAEMPAERDAALKELAGSNPGMAQRLENYRVRPGWSGRAFRLYWECRQREQKLREDLRKAPMEPKLPQSPTEAKGVVCVLRKWASCTTVSLVRSRHDVQRADSGATGGGYFLWWDGWGLAIDPGLGFGDLFTAQGFVPRNINAIVATHHHIDHTGDMLPIITTLFEMGEEEINHRAHFYLAPGAFVAYADLLAYMPKMASVVSLHPDGPTPVTTPKADLWPVPARHKDLTGRTDSAIGLIVDLKDEDGKCVCRVGFSGDTGFTKGCGKRFANVDLLVVHVGSVYPADVVDVDSQERLRQTQPQGHLGVMGAVDLIIEAKSSSRKRWNPLLLLSEWGEELGPARTEICQVVANMTDLKRVYPAEVNATVALCDHEALPVCGYCPSEYAAGWHTDDKGDIQYVCEAHTHPHDA